LKEKGIDPGGNLKCLIHKKMTYYCPCGDKCKVYKEKGEKRKCNYRGSTRSAFGLHHLYVCPGCGCSWTYKQSLILGLPDPTDDRFYFEKKFTKCK
jgi:hypothetical protein